MQHQVKAEKERTPAGRETMRELNSIPNSNNNPILQPQPESVVKRLAITTKHDHAYVWYYENVSDEQWELLVERQLGEPWCKLTDDQVREGKPALVRVICNYMQRMEFDNGENEQGALDECLSILSLLPATQWPTPKPKPPSAREVTHENAVNALRNLICTLDGNVEHLEDVHIRACMAALHDWVDAAENYMYPEALDDIPF